MKDRRPSLVDMPTWPRMLSEPEAAAYVGLSVNTFRGHTGKIFPAPVYIGHRKLFDRVALDRACDKLSEGEPNDAPPDP